jgi:hypothetical protein
MAKRTGESPRTALRKASAARLRLLRREDKADSKWLAECHSVLREAAKDRGVTEFEAWLDHSRTPLPLRPTGFDKRQQYCNRCGGRIQLNEQYDARFCGTCRRWTESKCSDPKCQFCTRRPARPVP